jgi:hypothetical protein
MRRNLRRILVAIVVVASATSLSLFTYCRHDTAGLQSLDSVCFETQVLPTIIGNCTRQGCHSGSGGLFPLTTYKQIMAKVKAGKPYSSDLYNAITGKYFTQQMPPDHALTEEQRTYIRIWILQGAQYTTCSDTTSTGSNTDGTTTSCDLNNVTYSATVNPILSSSCVSCHSASNAKGGVILTDYSHVQSVATSGKLVGVITQNGYSLMPPGGSLSSCNINQIKTWVTAGSLNN